MQSLLSVLGNNNAINTFSMLIANNPDWTLQELGQANHRKTMALQITAEPHIRLSL